MTIPVEVFTVIVSIFSLSILSLMTWIVKKLGDMDKALGIMHSEQDTMKDWIKTLDSRFYPQHRVPY